MVKIKLYLCMFAFMVLSAVVSGQQVTARASVDSSRYQVGDYINLKIVFTADKTVKLNPPAVKDSLKGLELIRTDNPSSVEKDGITTTTYSFIVSKYDSGGVRIPQLPVTYKAGNDTAKRTVLTNELNFTVTTLKVKADEEIKDIKAPVRIPLDWKLILLYIIIALLIAAAAYYIYIYIRNKRRMRAGIVPVIKKLPHETALEALTELNSKKLWQQGQIKEYHSEITEIIRRYFEDRFHVPALESTTNELVSGLASVPEAEKIIDTTSAFLNNADLVKFAKFVPVNNVNEEMMQQAFSIVESTRETPAEKNQENANV